MVLILKLAPTYFIPSTNRQRNNNSSSVPLHGLEQQQQQQHHPQFLYLPQAFIEWLTSLTFALESQ